MGVKLKDIINPQNITFKDLKDKTVAIDAFNTLYQFLSTIRQRDGTPLMDENGDITSHLIGILYRNSSMIDKGVKPIYIFDGKPPELKQETIAKRRESRDESEKKWEEAIEKGDIKEANKFAKRSSKLSPYIIESSKELLKLMGIPYVEACGEGEAQASYLVKKGDAYAVASQDYDCLLFGSEKVVRNLAVSSKIKSMEYYELKKVLNSLNVTQEQLVEMGILIGTDFNIGLKRVGAKTALKYAKNNKLSEAIHKLENTTGQDIEEVKNIFLNPKVNKNYKINWHKPKKLEILDYLCEQHGFSQERVVTATEKLKNLNSRQKSLEDWF